MSPLGSGQTVRHDQEFLSGQDELRGNFEFLAGEGIEAGIKVRADSNPAWAGPRGEVVRACLADPEG